MSVHEVDEDGRQETEAPLHVFVRRLTTVPVKGTRLHEPTSVRFDMSGIVGDRLFYVIDEAGRPVNGRQVGELSTVNSSYDAATGELTLVFADDTRVCGVPGHTGESVVSDFFSHDVKGWFVDGPWAEALTDRFGRELHLMSTASPGEACDRHPVSIISTASMDYLATKTEDPAAGVDHRRFRMMLELGGCRPHEEDTWQGRFLRVGEAIVEVLEAVPRCSVIRQDPSTGIRSTDLLKLVNGYRSARASDEPWPIRQPPDERQIMFGRYGTVVSPGEVRVGDRVELLEREGLGEQP